MKQKNIAGFFRIKNDRVPRHWSNYEVDLIQHQWGRRLSRRLAVKRNFRHHPRTPWGNPLVKPFSTSDVSPWMISSNFSGDFRQKNGSPVLDRTKLEPPLFIRWNMSNPLHSHLAAVLCSSSHLVGHSSASQREELSTVKTSKSSNII